MAAGPDGRSLDIAAYAGPTAHVRVAAAGDAAQGASLTLRHEEPQAEIQIDAGKEAEIPAGTWTVTHGSLHLRHGTGLRTSTTFLWCRSASRPVDAAAGTTVELVVDRPDRITFSAWRPQPDRIEIESFSLCSPSGLQWEASGSDDAKIATWLVASGQADRRGGTLERG